MSFYTPAWMLDDKLFQERMERLKNASERQASEATGPHSSGPQDGEVPGEDLSPGGTETNTKGAT